VSHLSNSENNVCIVLNDVLPFVALA